MTLYQRFTLYHDEIWCSVMGKNGIKFTVKDTKPGAKKSCPECGRKVELRRVGKNLVGFPRHKQKQPVVKKSKRIKTFNHLMIQR